MTLLDELRAHADTGDFSGSVSVTRHGESLAELHRGYAHRALERPIGPDTMFATASFTKGFTAVTTMSLIESGELTLDTPIKQLIQGGLELVDPEVTIEHLLAHTSGIGDYLDEDEIDDIDDDVLGLPAQRLAGPDDFLPLLQGHPQQFAPGAQFAYNNGGFVLLSIALERATGASYFDLVRERLFEPAGMIDTAFLRSDDLPARAAIGYLENGRSNVFNLPVRGVGDGGAYSTIADIKSFWTALFAGDVLPRGVVDTMVAPHTTTAATGYGYGLGFWLQSPRYIAQLEGMDAGVSCRTTYDPGSGLGFTVISNTSTGAWPIARHLVEWLEQQIGIATG